MNPPIEAVGVDAVTDSRQKAGQADLKPKQPLGEHGDRMRIAPWYLAALAPFAAIGYSGAHLGHVFVVLLTVGIFLGTLSLGRTRNGALPTPQK